MREFLPQAVEEEPDFTPLEAETFEEARAIERPLSDDFIVGALTRNLEISPGHVTQLVKHYLDQVPATGRDKEFASDPEEMTLFHAQVARFISTHVKLSKVTPFTEGEQGVLQKARQTYRERLRRGADVVRDYIPREKAWKHGDEDRPDYPRGAFGYHGLTVPTSQGRRELTDIGMDLSGIGTNIKVQRELMGSFVHYASGKHMRNRLSNTREEGNYKRIYLNPDSEKAVKIFTEIVGRSEQAGLDMQGKIWDRSAEALGQIHRETTDVRGDGIVLYAKGDAQELLDIAIGVYDEYVDALEGRDVSKVPQRLADGLAIGDDSEESGASLTSHRSELLAKVANMVRKDFSYSIKPEQYQEAVQRFRHYFAREAARENVNPQNIAFNAH